MSAMPAVRFDPSLLAEVVLPLLGKALRTRYHFESDALYEKYLPEHRAEAFAALDTRMFRELPQHDAFAAALRDAGPLPGVQEVRVTGARGSEEGADLATTGELAMLRLGPGRLRGDVDGLRAFLLHELSHLVDLLDPGFGYRREDPAPGEMRSWANLVRDRYRVLWNASVDGRLARRGETLPGTGEARRNELRRVFAGLGAAAAERLFEETWNGRLCGHRALLAAARRRGGSGKEQGLQPGDTCPLCGFSAWVVAKAADAAGVTAAVGVDFPQWAPDEGLCGHCFELYEMRTEEGTWKSAEGIC